MSPSPRTIHGPQAVALGALALAGALTLSSCSASGAAEGREGSLAVVATTTQLADFTAEIGGDDIALTGLLQAGASAHHFDPTPADLLALSEADVLVVNGADLESFIDSAIEASGFDGEIITAADGLDAALLEEIAAEAEGAHADDDHAHEHAEETDDAHSHEHEHDHGSINPHIWTSPANAVGMVDEIAAGLAAADPTHAAGYTARADAYTQQLTDLDAWAAAQFERVPEAERVLVSGHDSLRYYLHDYDIAFAGSILPSFEDNAEPSAAEIDALVASIREHNVQAVFVESSMSPKLAQTIAREAGIEVIDADTLFADALGAAGTDGDTYLGATAHNTRVILEAWGAEVDELPASLQR